MNNMISAFDTATYIVFTVLIVLALIGICVLMFFRIRRDSIKYGGKHDEKGIMTLENFKKSVDRAMLSLGKRTRYFFFQIDIREYDALKKTLGEEQYGSIIREQCDVLSKLQPYGIKLGMKKQDSILLFIKSTEQADLDSVCRLIIESLAKNYKLSDNMSLDINVNVAAEIAPEAGETFDELIKNLEISMVVSRRKGENRYALYSPQFGNAETEEYKYYQEIREAMKAKEFTLFYQPIVETNSLEVSGAETLMRWIHHTKGVLPPSEFLYVMEQTGDINWVGFWCFEQMVKQFAQWQANYAQKFDLSFNLSERQLLNPELADEMKKIVREYKMDASSFEVEISDMPLYNSSEVVKHNLDKLYQYGFKICLDGFGTKFTSPTALESLPITAIKIDKEFWSRMGSSTMIDNIIQMVVDFGKEKNVRLIAFGVENKIEMNMLREHGINYMQGYAFGKPKDAKDFIGDVVFTPWTEDLK